jgi:Uma2 family endonuclease
MATTTATTPAKMTAEEFFDWANRPENGGKRYELERGEVVEMPSPGVRHGTVCWILGGIIWQYLSRWGAGHATTNDAGLIVQRKPDTVRGPDLMVFLDAKRYDDLEVKYAERVPTLVIEVLSPEDRAGKTNRRIEQYIRRGVPLVWLVDPEDRIVTVYRPDELHKTLDETDELTGNGVLPDFSCRVADLFALPGSPPPTPAPPPA